MHAYNEGVEFQFAECFARASHCKSIKAEVVNLTSETRPATTPPATSVRAHARHNNAQATQAQGRSIL